MPSQPAVEDERLRCNVWGLTFPNPVGLAAGFDKNAEGIHCLQRQGFGFLELGTVTPQPQPGNPKPRLFRLAQDRAVINRFGFNSQGLEAFCHNIQSANPTLPIGGNIGKNKNHDDALADYVAGYRAVYPLVDYITVNISSPNTAGLRELQGKAALHALLQGLGSEKLRLSEKYKTTKPLLVKIAPDLTPKEVEELLEVVTAQPVDGLIVSNTTLARPENLQSHQREESGGLSGKPLTPLALGMIKTIYRATSGKLPLIGVGGISDGKDAYARLRAGASLLQLYSALIYEGFALIPRINRELLTLMERDGVGHIAEIIGTDCAN